jgi:hypothetical protein
MPPSALSEAPKSEPPDSVIPKEARGQIAIDNARTRNRLMEIAAISALVASVGAVALSIVNAVKPRDEAIKATYEAGAQRLDKFAAQMARDHDVNEQRWNYLLGRFDSQPTMTVSTPPPGSARNPVVVFSPPGKEEEPPKPIATAPRPAAPAAASFDALTKD